MTSKADLVPELLRIAHALADAGRVETLAHFRKTTQNTTSKSKVDFDPVTVADRAAETAMRALLAEHRPNDGILGEEFEPVEGSSGLSWIIDPIDGTRAFISGTPTWGILIALADDTGPVLGVIDQPFTRERFLGGLGVATHDHGGVVTALGTRDTAALDEAVIFTTFPEVGTPADRAGFEAVAPKCRLTRYGLDCYAYGLLALGQIDLVIEAGLQPYDICAPIAVIEAAGGLVTNWRGGPAHGGGQVVAAANATLHARALELLEPFAD